MGSPILDCKSVSKLQVTKQPNNLMKSPLQTFHQDFPPGQPARYPFLDFKNDPELAGVILFVSVLLLPRLVLINFTRYLPGNYQTIPYSASISFSVLSPTWVVASALRVTRGVREQESKSDVILLKQINNMSK